MMSGMSGFETTKKIQETYPLIPIIMHTAYQKEHSISEVVEHGFEGYLVKGNIRLDEVYLTVERACEKYKLRKENEEYKQSLERKVEERTRELEEVQDELVKERTMAAIGVLATGVAHNMRNNLETIRRSFTSLENYVQQIFKASYLLEDFGIERREKKSVASFLHSKYLSGLCASMDSLRASRRGKELKVVFEGHGIPLRDTESRKLAESDIREEDVSFVSTLMKKYGNEKVIRLLKFSHKLGHGIHSGKTSINRGFHVINNTLSMSELQKNQETAFDLNESIEEVLSYMSDKIEGMDISLQKDLDPNLPPYTINPKVFSTVLEILIDNSIYAVGGNREQKIIGVQSTYDDESIQIISYDNGCGIAGEERDKIFQPFYTTKEEGEGTGLGLYIAYNLISPNGSIDVESDEWTTFSIRLHRE